MDIDLFLEIYKTNPSAHYILIVNLLYGLTVLYLKSKFFRHYRHTIDDLYRTSFKILQNPILCFPRLVSSNVHKIITLHSIY